MGSNTRVPFASLAALAAVASAHSAETNASAVESAKRDLRTLPAAQTQIDPVDKQSLFSGSSALPGLSLAAPAPGTPAPKKSEDAQKTPSGGWLLDGVRGLEAESQQRRADDLKRANGSAGTRPANSAAPVNPLADYLTQWLSPRDQLRFADGGNANGFSSLDATSFSESAAIERKREAAAESLVASPFQSELTLPAATDFAGNKRGVNPYLSSPLQPAPERTPFNVGTAPVSALPAISAPPDRTFQPPVPVPLPQAKPAPAAQPTSPLVDDRKYFPQLRRF